MLPHPPLNISAVSCALVPALPEDWTRAVPFLGSASIGHTVVAFGGRPSAFERRIINHFAK